LFRGNPYPFRKRKLRTAVHPIRARPRSLLPEGLDVAEERSPRAAPIRAFRQPSRRKIHPEKKGARPKESGKPTAKTRKRASRKNRQRPNQRPRRAKKGIPEKTLRAILGGMLFILMAIITSAILAAYVMAGKNRIEVSAPSWVAALFFLGRDTGDTPDTNEIRQTFFSTSPTWSFRQRPSLKT
jgi:hypothetical protein